MSGVRDELQRAGKSLLWLLGVDRTPRPRPPAKSLAEVREMLVRHLTHDAAAHEEGRTGEVGAGYEEVLASLPHRLGPEWRDVNAALSFWDSWIDARNHDWRYHEPIRRGDWPVLARRRADDLAARRHLE